MTRGTAVSILAAQWAVAFVILCYILYHQSSSGACLAAGELGTACPKSDITWKWLLDGLCIPLAILLSVFAAGLPRKWRESKTQPIRFWICLLTNTAYLIFFFLPFIQFLFQPGTMTIADTLMFTINNTGMALWQGIIIGLIASFLWEGRE